MLRLAWMLKKAPVVLTITHSQANTPCWYHVSSATELTGALRAWRAIASYSGMRASEIRSTMP